MKKKDFSNKITAVKKKLYSTALIYLGNEADSMDAVDEAIFKAYKSINTLRHEEFFNTWLIRILINECKKELRRKKKSICFGYN